MSAKKNSFGILSYGLIYLVLGIGASILTLLFLNRALLLHRASRSISNTPFSQFLIGFAAAAVVFLLLSISVLRRKNYTLVVVLTFLLASGSVLLKIYYSFSTVPYMILYILLSWPVIVFLLFSVYYFCRPNTREMFRQI
jgi:hypothetical protein